VPITERGEGWELKGLNKGLVRQKGERASRHSATDTKRHTVLPKNKIPKNPRGGGQINQEEGGLPGAGNGNRRFPKRIWEEEEGESQRIGASIMGGKELEFLQNPKRGLERDPVREGLLCPLGKKKESLKNLKGLQRKN